MAGAKQYGDISLSIESAKCDGYVKFAISVEISDRDSIRLIVETVVVWPTISSVAQVEHYHERVAVVIEADDLGRIVAMRVRDKHMVKSSGISRLGSRQLRKKPPSPDGCGNKRSKCDNLNPTLRRAPTRHQLSDMEQQSDSEFPTSCLPTILELQGASRM